MASGNRSHRHDYDPSDYYPDHHRYDVLHAVDAHRDVFLAALFLERLQSQDLDLGRTLQSGPGGQQLQRTRRQPLGSVRP